MVTLIKVFVESIRQAIQEMVGNKLRSFLSLLGITIGIFCIIGVKSAVNSLESQIRSSFDQLGNNVIYVSQFSWTSNPMESWWKWMRHPMPNFKDYQEVTKRIRNADLVSFHTVVGLKTAKYLSNSVDRAILLGATFDFWELNQLELDHGRYFSPIEYQYGSNKAILGYKVAEELFGKVEPVGKSIKIQGKKVEVIGVMEKSGDDLFKIMNFDEVIMISYPLARKFANLDSRRFQSLVTVKAASDKPLEEVKDELTGILRAHRRLKPKEENNFAINELTMLTNILDGFFQVLNLAGIFIGIFAIFVGMFSVANIMFVSVKERTNIIGIKKALGAKQYVILLEFLVEAIVLCIIGGILGLGLVYGTTLLLSTLTPFPIFLSFNNIMIGVLVSIVVGILAGVIPALSASQMDPVEAMRH